MRAFTRSRSVAAEKTSKNARHQVGSDPLSGVTDQEACAVQARVDAQRDTDFTGRRGELDGVVEQIAHYLTQMNVFAADDSDRQVLHFQVQALGFGNRLKHVDR